MNKFLFKQVDNTGLVLFRVFFGLLITLEAFGAIATGWVRINLVEPNFTFNFIGFDFLQSFTGNGMYLYFFVMGVLGVLVMLGYKYRFAIVGYAIMWTGVYLMQKTSYNNHYYLMLLLCWIMAFLPANRWFSIDASANPKLQSVSMPQWVPLLIIIQVWIVYTYASVAKIYPDWLDGTALSIMMAGKKNYWLIGELLQAHWVHMSMAYFGIFFDLLIVPMLLWKRTRMLGFIISIFFHLHNSIIFQIGIFPYMSISFALFFFSPELLRKRFFPKKDTYNLEKISIPNYRKLLVGGLMVYLLIQIGLPVRHWSYQDNVLWTEEGHRLSWRMMLRSKSGTLTTWVVDSKTGERRRFDYTKLITQKQQSTVRTKPDLLWQLAQMIYNYEAEAGREVAVYMESKVQVNGRKYVPFIDPNINLAAEEWNHFKHHDWILPFPVDYHKKKLEN